MMIAYHTTYYYISQNWPYIEAFKKTSVCSNTLKECKEYFWGQSTLTQCLANKP